MRVTRWGELGLLCCVYLAKGHAAGPVGAQELARNQALPLDYTQQILQRLRKGGIVKSVRGPHGGYLLERAPQLISLKDILRALEGETLEIVCEVDPVYADFCKSNDSCGLKSLWRGLKQAVDGYLESVNLAALVEDQQRRGERGRDTLVSIKGKSKA